MPLLENAKQELFCREFHLHRNATKAAKDAGYSAKTAAQIGSRLLKDVKIQARIAELKAEAEANFGITRERFDAHLAAIAFQSMDDYMTFTTDGDPIVDVSRATPMQRSAISKLKVEDYLEGRGEDARDVRKIEITMHPKLPALVKVGELMGYLKDPAESAENVIERLMQFYATGISSPDSPLAGDDEDDEE